MNPKLEQVKREISEVNFNLECGYSGTLVIHDRNFEENTIMCLRKTANKQQPN
jgi:hypothetical protein